MKIILVTGDRNWSDRELMFSVLDEEAPDIIIEGEARGADRMSAQWADARRVLCVPMPAYWELHGKAAGPIRNREMLELLLRYKVANDVGCVAFHKNIAQSKGTANMIAQCGRAGVHVRLVS